MFADARDFQQPAVDADICVIGAGPAGITIARNFAGSETRVLVLESGGLEFSRAAQNLAKGTNAGLQYEALDLCRVRKFGGSTGKMGWGGWCKPLNEQDLALRPWVPMSGWPVTLQELQPYYLRALSTFDLPAYDFGPKEAENRADDHNLRLTNTAVTVEESLLAPATGYSLSGAATELQAESNILVLLHGVATEITADPQTRRVTGVEVKTLTGRTLSVSAQWVVLAAGGIENPRLLLQSNRQYPNGIGNTHDLVGRCFMEHPRFSWGRLSSQAATGIIQLFDPTTIVRQRLSRGDATQPVVGRGLKLRSHVQQEDELLNARTWIMRAPASGESEGGRELKEAVFWLKKSRIPDAPIKRIAAIARDLPGAMRTALCHLRPPNHWQFVTICEQEPILSSRVTLDAKRDALGLNAVRLEWHLGPMVERTLKRNQEIISTTLAQLGLDCSGGAGRGSSRHEAESVRWVWHHMGTTRMGADPSQGVVDRNCRVHGIKNLYVAGSSVFPTGGNDMPTLTIVALAHRLSDHLRDCMKMPDAVHCF